MHEETNQYYYWNIETGETSWEVPAIFSQGTEFSTAPEVLPVTEELENTPLNNNTSYSLHGGSVVYPSMSAGDHCDGAHLIISNDEEKYKLRDEVEGYTNENVVYPEFGSGMHQTDLERTHNGIFSSESIDTHPVTANLHQETGFDVSARIVSYAKNLLQRLKDLNRYGIQVQDWDWVSKYILEIEIRLSDFKSLLAYGPSLLPFWMHSEEKLKGIEHAVSVYMSNSTNSGLTLEANAEMVSAHRNDSISCQGIEGISELTAGDQPVVLGFVKSLSSPNDATSATQKEAEDVSIPLNDVTVDENIQETSEASHIERVGQQPVIPSTLEDEDMELDEEITASDQKSGDMLVAKCRSPGENFIQSVSPAECTNSALEKGHDVPPPPDEEWIPPPPPDAEPVPPPPPDTEPVPPPPPDDPLAPTYTSHPPYTDTVPPFPYIEQYNMSYSASASEYYGPTMTGIPSSNYNASSEESQAVVSQSSQYFDTTYSETTSLVVNPMEPSAYYSIPNETVPLLPAISGFQSYAYNASDPASHHDTTADQAEALKALPESGNMSLSHLKGESDARAVSHETELLAAQIPSIPTTVQVVTTAAPVVLTSGTSTAVVPSVTAPKAPNKGTMTGKPVV